MLSLLCLIMQFLLTRLCEARPANPDLCDVLIFISTHAPLRGATAPRAVCLVDVEFLLTRLCEARPLHLVPNGSRISIYRKRRTFFRKSTMIQHFSYPDCTLF